MFHKENLIFKVCLYELFICRTQADFKPVKRTHILRVEAATTAAVWREEGKDVTVVTGRAALCHPSSFSYSGKPSSSLVAQRAFVA